MKTRSIAVLLCLLASCAGTPTVHQGYPGVERPAAELATVRVQPRNTNLFSGLAAPITGSKVRFWNQIRSVDGQTVSAKAGSVTLLPGEHSFDVYTASEMSSDLYYTGEAQWTCTIPAAGNYQLITQLGAEGEVRIVLRDEERGVNVSEAPVTSK